MNRYERLNRLLQILAERGTVEVEAVAAELSASLATVRRDLDHLAEQQLLTRTRGGAVANNVAYDLPLRYKTARHSAEKQRIGEAAARLVAPGTVVGLNGGTTMTEVARALAVRPDLNTTGEGAQLTVVTNALNIANELLVRSRMKIVVAGGVVRPQSFELVGPLGSALLNEVTLDIALLGVDAVDVELGAAAHHEGEAAMNSLMVNRAKRVVVIADSSKLGGHAFARICPIERVQTLVTDSGAAPEAVRAFRDAGLDVGDSYPVEQELGWGRTEVPKTYEGGTRFEILSLGSDPAGNAQGGRAFVFGSEGDLATMRDYYENLTGAARPYVYVENNALVQLASQLPQAEAERYGAVLREIA